MKVTFVVVLSVAYFAMIYGLPAKSEGSEEVEFVPLEDQNGGQPVITTGVIGGPWFNPFDGLFESFASIMSRMRQQMDFLLRQIPLGNSTRDDGHFPGFPDIDLSKGNTTSVTKVIDGHKVVINETEYKQEGEFGGSFFKVRIIDVLPTNSNESSTEENAETITNTPKDTESIEESSLENEIPKNREVFTSAEIFDEPDTRFQNEKITNRAANWDNIETFDSIEDNSIESVYPPNDLSRDIYVNELMADAGVPFNPDAEVFSSVETFNSYPHPRRWQPFEKIVYPR